MGKYYILVFILSAVFIIYVVHKRMKQKEEESHMNDNKDDRK